MTQTFLLNLIFLHFAFSTIFLLAALKAKWPLHITQILPMLFIPVFGPVSTLIAIITDKSFVHNTDAIISEFQGSVEDPYWKTLRAPETKENIVPLEEALIINDRSIRKQLVFDTLLEDPLKNIDILLLARENNDVDTAHYANTTISKIQRDFQLQIQKLSAAVEKEPENLDLLDRYIHVLDQFINSGLSEAYLLRKQRIILFELLERRLKIAGLDKYFLDLKVQNSIALGEFNEASAANRIRKEKWPLDQQTWINELQICVDSRDPIRLKQTLAEAESADIHWTEEGRRKVALWLGEKA